MRHQPGCASLRAYWLSAIGRRCRAKRLAGKEGRNQYLAVGQAEKGTADETQRRTPLDRTGFAALARFRANARTVAAFSPSLPPVTSYDHEAQQNRIFLGNSH